MDKHWDKEYRDGSSISSDRRYANENFYALTSDGMRNKKRVKILIVQYWKGRETNHAPTLENIKEFLLQVPFDEKIVIYADEDYIDDSTRFYGKLHSAYTPLYTAGAITVDAIVDENNNMIWNLYAKGKHIEAGLDNQPYGLRPIGVPNGDLIKQDEVIENYAEGGGIKGKELWFSPYGEVKAEKRGTAKDYIEKHLAKSFGAEYMELVGEDENDYIYELNGNPMMIAAKTAILQEETDLDIETYGRKKRVHIPKKSIDQTSVHLRYPLITPFKNGGAIKTDFNELQNTELRNVLISFWNDFFNNHIGNYLSIEKENYILSNIDNVFVIVRDEDKGNFSNVEKQNIDRFLSPYFDSDKKPLFTDFFNNYEIKDNKIIIYIKEEKMYANGGGVDSYPFNLTILVSNKDYAKIVIQKHNGVILNESQRDYGYEFALGSYDWRVLDKIADELYDKGFFISQYSKGGGVEDDFWKQYSNDALNDMIVNLSRFENTEDMIEAVKFELKNRSHGNSKYWVWYVNESNPIKNERKAKSFFTNDKQEAINFAYSIRMGYSKVAENKNNGFNSFMWLIDAIPTYEQDFNDTIPNRYTERYANGGGVGKSKKQKGDIGKYTGKQYAYTLSEAEKGWKRMLVSPTDYWKKEEGSVYTDSFGRKQVVTERGDKSNMMTSYAYRIMVLLDLGSKNVPASAKKYAMSVYKFAPNEISAKLYKYGGGIETTDYSDLAFASKTFSKTSEMLVRENLNNGEICMCKLTKILGQEPNYPFQIVGSLKLEKCFMKRFYRIV